MVSQYFHFFINIQITHAFVNQKNISNLGQKYYGLLAFFCNNNNNNNNNNNTNTVMILIVRVIIIMKLIKKQLKRKEASMWAYG